MTPASWSPDPEPAARSGGAYLDFSLPSDAVVSPNGRAGSGRLLDRRSSAAMLPPEEPPVEDRRNAVALSLAGLFEEGPAPEAAPASEPKHRPKVARPLSALFDDAPEEEATPRRKRSRLRAVLSPGGIIAILAIVGALYVVGTFVARSHASKPPNPDQVTTVTR